jgi:hypothetical protein
MLRVRIPKRQKHRRENNQRLQDVRSEIADSANEAAPPVQGFGVEPKGDADQLQRKKDRQAEETRGEPSKNPFGRGQNCARNSERAEAGAVNHG